MRTSVRLIKRLVDSTGALLGLALCAPALPLIAAAIYLDSPGPVFYRQRRAGKLAEKPGNGHGLGPSFCEFEMYKFRTMRPDAERMTGAVLAAENDPRVTRIGRILRKTRLDELPQLWNVVRGDMSLVGPRPERPELLANLALAIPFFEERMRSVKPGITGLAQVSLGYTGRALAGSAIEPHVPALTNPFKLEEAVGAEADDMRMKLLYDLAYAACLERLPTYLTTELRILLRTPVVMLKGLGR